MVTSTTAHLPIPKSWDEFEDICKDAFSLRWNSPDLQRHGRSGQKQDGVDIYGHDHLADFVGIQCKNTHSGINKSVIDEEILKAEKFRPELDALYIATTAPRDTEIQRHARDVSEARKKGNKFPVNVVFWDDLTLDLSRDDTVIRKHFPMFFVEKKLTKEEQLRNRDISNLKSLLKLIEFNVTLRRLNRDAKYIHHLLVEEFHNVLNLRLSSVFYLNDKKLMKMIDDMILEWWELHHLCGKAPYDYIDHISAFSFTMPGDICRNKEEDALYEQISNQMKTLMKSITSFCDFLHSNYHEIDLNITNLEAQRFYS
ncbi:hypothetical protein [Atlantibacter hermannii]|uniref:hypothetical protein n=1 Tax=Atlantibacter hermannii TaxID=565 RepID=UPI0028A23481|nr:hypothetical protein [Atlantibacter hermannii]